MTAMTLAKDLFTFSDLEIKLASKFSLIAFLFYADTLSQYFMWVS